ncbi:uncharacterized protein PSFLO_07644 [Pseudozyma flocculosa]|uniref:Uncharacterized protein n=1 Tax=Pseudozyma flocculosa TaxID=84751 RepID=A0A5C3FFA2_9BASI|nr:uncharacterized protein PSFLO_07644 [Pseudozyma flocculosa]
MIAQLPARLPACLWSMVAAGDDVDDSAPATTADLGLEGPGVEAWATSRPSSWKRRASERAREPGQPGCGALSTAQTSRASEGASEPTSKQQSQEGCHGRALGPGRLLGQARAACLYLAWLWLGGSARRDRVRWGRPAGQARPGKQGSLAVVDPPRRANPSWQPAAAAPSWLLQPPGLAWLAWPGLPGLAGSLARIADYLLLRLARPPSPLHAARSTTTSVHPGPPSPHIAIAPHTAAHTAFPCRLASPRLASPRLVPTRLESTRQTSQVTGIRQPRTLLARSRSRICLPYCLPVGPSHCSLRRHTLLPPPRPTPSRASSATLSPGPATSRRHPRIPLYTAAAAAATAAPPQHLIRATGNLPSLTLCRTCGSDRRRTCLASSSTLALLASRNLATSHQLRHLIGLSELLCQRPSAIDSACLWPIATSQTPAFLPRYCTSASSGLPAFTTQVSAASSARPVIEPPSTLHAVVCSMRCLCVVPSAVSSLFR